MSALRHFVHLRDRAPEEILRLVDAALALKAAPPAARPLAGKSLAFCFMNPSLRTQVSFAAATHSLGGLPITLNMGSGGTWGMEAAEGVVMDGTAAEHLKEAVPVLGRYCAAVALRSFPAGKSWAEDKAEPHLSAFRRWSTVPVINMESATGHPCQALADLMTIQERMAPRGKNFLLTWAPHIKALPTAVADSAVEIAALAGMNVTIARPEGWDLDADVMARVRASCAANGARLTVTDDPAAAYAGQHVVYAKSWGSLRDYGAPPPSDAAFRAKWMVDAAKMRRAADPLFLHCLPVRRNLVVADEVLDGPWSAVIDEAENRLHAAKAVLLDLLAPETAASAVPPAAPRRHPR